MKREDAEDFTQALGQIVGGSWRLIAHAKKQGVPKALGLSVETWVDRRLGGYVRMSIADRREAVKELAAEGQSTRAIAEVLGTNQSTIVRDLADANASADQVEANDGAPPNGDADANASPLSAVAALAADDKIRVAARIAEARQAGEEKRKADLERPVTVALPEGIIHGDFYELSRSIPDDSIDFIFTDPPYDADSVPLYEKAAEVAARILKPGGSFIAYSGVKHQADVVVVCRKYLVHWWTCAVVHEGGDQLLQKLGIRCGWKPLVWFVKQTRGDVQNVMADIVRGDREKGEHEWQQSTIEARYFIQCLSTPGGYVVDFFLGSGTTAVAAAELGRRFIGYEINAATIERAAQRIARIQ